MRRWLALVVLTAACNRFPAYNKGPCGAEVIGDVETVEVDPLDVELRVQLEFLTPADAPPMDLLVSVTAGAEGQALTRPPTIEEACFVGPIITHEGVVSFDATFSGQALSFVDATARVERSPNLTDGVGITYFQQWMWDELPPEIALMTPDEEEGWEYKYVAAEMTLVHEHPELGTMGKFGFYLSRDDGSTGNSIFFASATIHPVESE